jgi:uncharacterized protein (TIGR03435 family)
VFALMVAIASNSLTAQPESVRPGAFESVSVRAAASADLDQRFVATGGSLIIRATPLRAIIAALYDVDVRQISGGPLWIDDEPFDIEAVASSAVSGEELVRMAKAMLAERFQLSLRSGRQELPVYELTTARTDKRLGRGIAISANRCRSGRTGERAACDINVPEGSIAAAGTTIAAFAAKHLAPLLGRVIVDHTGLTGRFDIILRLPTGEQEAPLTPVTPSTVAAEVQAQLGLKLRATSGSVPILIVDRVERPISN